MISTISFTLDCNVPAVRRSRFISLGVSPKRVEVWGSSCIGVVSAEANESLALQFGGTAARFPSRWSFQSPEVLAFVNVQTLPMSGTNPSYSHPGLLRARKSIQRIKGGVLVVGQLIMMPLEVTRSRLI
jgi:hypothetical protein